MLSLMAAVLLLLPLAWALAGIPRMRAGATDAVRPARWSWRITGASALLYTLAFNLTFFVQEVFLVVPKALTPGLRPTLYHNNHGWEGTHALAHLFQGTGALATLLLGVAAGCWLRRGAATRAPWQRLGLFWLAFAGVYMALFQLVLAPLLPRGDVGLALAWLGVEGAGLTAVGVAALGAVPVVAIWLLRPLMALAASPERVATPLARMGFVFRAVTLPALLACALIVPYRVPREWIEVAGVPVLVTLTGLLWLQAAAWRVVPGETTGHAGHAARWPVAGLLLASAALLVFFQAVLRPGIAFY